MSGNSNRIKSMMRLRHLLIFSLILPLTGSGAEVEYLGSVTEGLIAPTALYVDSDKLVALEPYSKELALFTPAGLALERVNVSGWVTGLQALAPEQYLFCDRKSGRVVALDVGLHTQTDFLSAAENIDPTDILVRGDRVYVLDAENARLNLYDIQGTPLASDELVDDSGKRIGFPAALTYDETTSQFFVLDQTASSIWTLDSTGRFTGSFAAFGAGAGEITRGGTVRCDRQGLCYVSDRFQGRIVVFNVRGEFVLNIDLSVFGQGRLMTPIGLALDESDILYVASTESAAIHLFKVTGYSDAQVALQVRQLYPLHGDTVEASSVTLSVESFTNWNQIADATFDFELYIADDSLNPVDTASARRPLDSLSTESGVAVAEWHSSTELLSDTLYSWRVRLRTGDQLGPWSGLQSFYTSALPRSFSLGQNYPNPFNPNTKILFNVVHETQVTITVINLLGQKVVTLVDDALEAGEHWVIWNGENSNGATVASGVYFYRMKAAEFTATKKMVVVK